MVQFLRKKLRALSSLQQRILSAAIALPLFMFVLFQGGFLFTAVMIIGAMVAGSEWLNLISKNKNRMVEYIFYSVLAIPLCFSVFFGPFIGIFALLTGFVISLGFSFILGDDLPQNPPTHIASGVLYIGIPILCILWLRNDVVLIEGSPTWAAVLSLFIMVWVTDTGAYFSGKTIGGPKMAPSISPNKTWAGLIGGVVFTIIAGLILSLGFNYGSVLLFIILGVTLPLVAQAGDLFASFLKRRAGLKDTGRILPGHGGLIDRIDGVLTAAPFYTILSQLI